MAILVMLVIIILNIALLVVIMRLGTQGEHHAEFSADQSGAVLALHDRLGLPHPQPKQVAVVHEHAKDVVNTIDPKAEVVPTDSDSTKDVAEHEDEVAKFVNGDDSAKPAEDLMISKEGTKKEINAMKKAASNLQGEIDDTVADIKGELANAVKDAKDKLSTKDEVDQDDASDDTDDS